jgi:hypothetical protein
MEMTGEPHALASLTPGDVAAYIHHTGNWVGPIVSLDIVAKR